LSFEFWRVRLSKSLALNPDNENGKKMLSKIGEKRGLPHRTAPAAAGKRGGRGFMRGNQYSG